MGIRIGVLKEECSEQIIAYAKDRRGRIISTSEADQELWQEWQNSRPFGTLNRAQKKWKAMLNALKKLLLQLVKDGILSQEEADRIVDQWQKDHPEPQPEEAFEVTEEFEQKPIPIYIPNRIEVAEVE